MNTQALIVGAGPGLSASFARLLADRGHLVALAAILDQPRSCWTDEIVVQPGVERS